MSCMIRDCTDPTESGWLFCTKHVDAFHLREWKAPERVSAAEDPPEGDTTRTEMMLLALGPLEHCPGNKLVGAITSLLATVRRETRDQCRERDPNERNWKAEAEWATAVQKAKTERLDAYILTVGEIRKTIDMWRNKATASGDAMVQVFEAVDKLDEYWAKEVEQPAPSCTDPACGAPCQACWKAGKGRPVHPSNMRTIVDDLEDHVGRLQQSQATAWSKYRVLKSIVRSLLAAEERGQGVAWQESIEKLAQLVAERPEEQ